MEEIKKFYIAILNCTAFVMSITFDLQKDQSERTLHGVSLCS